MCLILWSWREDSNPRPADYKSAALPTELRQRRRTRVRILGKGLDKGNLPEIQGQVSFSGGLACMSPNTAEGAALLEVGQRKLT
jgi:hypothetical protein